ncbi:MAG: aminomethyl-transferring glycine dehydrogenase subunit GcvPA [Desulfobacterales bacterium]|nr:aminomethyl-transferring glycine dehydrogenase subunit GcvPA [Desulfobacterales bacterium]
MRYLPHTPEDIASMLAVAGVGSLEELFGSIPADCRRTAELQLPQPLTEWELRDHLKELSRRMAVDPEYTLFLGAGSYDHHIPAAIPYLLSRSEFVTSYTPYQPEMSQGTLQAIYEYQTLTARLLGIEVANASLYDGASALAEGLLMAIRITRRNRVAVSKSIHPFFRQVVRTYFKPTGYELSEIPYDATGRTDIAALEPMEDLAAIAVQTPNFFGCIEDLKIFAERAREKQALLVAAFTEPLAFGLYKNPGSQGADIVCGEGQSLGLPRSFGGPALGMLASRMKYVRSMPGRLVGKATDQNGKDGFVLTLSTREQHIRREKATSNICTNNSLCALNAAMFMATLGGTGMRKLARLNYDTSEYLKKALCRTGFQTVFAGPTFNEFVVKAPEGFSSTYERLLSQKIVAGLALEPFYPELRNHFLMCATETRTRREIDRLIEEVSA